MMAAQNAVTPASLPRHHWRVRDADGRKDAFYMARLWAHYFGTEYDAHWLPKPLAEIAGWHDDEESMDAYGVIAEHEDVAIGAGLATLLNHEDAVNAIPPGRFDREALAGDQNVFLWFNAVDPAWRGRGIGRMLFHRRLEWATAMNADMVLAYGWERRQGRTSRPLFEGYGFVPVQEFPGYYATEHADRDSCPDCGVWPSDDDVCECGITLWAIDGEEVLA